MRPVNWVSDLAFEGRATVDDRFITRDALNWRDLPMTLMAMTVNSGDGHVGSYVAGRIDLVTRDTHKTMDGTPLPKGEAAMRGQGQFDMAGENGSEIARLVEDETLRGVSVDLAVQDWQFRDKETGELIDKTDMTPAQEEKAFFGEYQLAVTDAVIVAATVCPTPAFDGARISVTAAGDERRWQIVSRFHIVDSLVAAAALPDRAAFTRPEQDPTPLTVTDDGELYGHIALWDSCHTGLADVCTQPPRSQSGYAYFHTGEVETSDGDAVAVGKLMFDGKHAPLSLTRARATQHYDDHTRVAAYVRAHDGRHGIWLSGVLRPDLDDEERQRIRANPPSGDWRLVNGGLELVAVLAVPIPGFPIPRAQVALSAAGSETEVTGLVVSGPIEPDPAIYQRRIETLAASAAADPVAALSALVAD
jgi:hypothetical protein